VTLAVAEMDTTLPLMYWVAAANPRVLVAELQTNWDFIQTFTLVEEVIPEVAVPVTTLVQPVPRVPRV